jgi:hypothetical protein
LDAATSKLEEATAALELRVQDLGKALAAVDTRQLSLSALVLTRASFLITAFCRIKSGRGIASVADVLRIRGLAA